MGLERISLAIESKPMADFINGRRAPHQHTAGPGSLWAHPPFTKSSIGKNPIEKERGTAFQKSSMIFKSIFGGQRPLSTDTPVQDRSACHSLRVQHAETLFVARSLDLSAKQAPLSQDFYKRALSYLRRAAQQGPPIPNRSVP